MAIRKTPEPAAAVREEVREEVRPGIGHNRPPAGRAVAVGRDGQPIWRHNSMHGPGVDKYAIPAEIIPPGWVYQWKRFTLLNDEQHQYMGQLRANGWTPVMAEVHPGMYMPLGHKGPIVVEGLMLMETPEELHREALRDEEQRAAEQVNTKMRAHGLAAASNTVSTDSLGDRRNTFVRKSIDPGVDIPRPKYDRTPID